MKTVANKIKNSNLEFFKRILYSFQVLTIGIAIPVLFMLGVSNRDQKKSTETEITKGINNAELSAKPSFLLPVVKI